MDSCDGRISNRSKARCSEACDPFLSVFLSHGVARLLRAARLFEELQRPAIETSGGLPGWTLVSGQRLLLHYHFSVWGWQARRLQADLVKIRAIVQPSIGGVRAPTARAAPPVRDLRGQEGEACLSCWPPRRQARDLATQSRHPARTAQHGGVPLRAHRTASMDVARGCGQLRPSSIEESGVQAGRRPSSG
jgi:hypothetical protein